MKTFGEHVAEALRAGVDRIELAEAFEAAPATVDHWAAGTAAPSPRVRGEIVRWCEVRVAAMAPQSKDESPK